MFNLTINWGAGCGQLPAPTVGLRTLCQKSPRGLRTFKITPNLSVLPGLLRPFPQVRLQVRSP